VAVTATAPLQAQLAQPRPTEKILLVPLLVTAAADSVVSVRAIDVARERVDKLARSKVIVIPKQKICEALGASGFPCDGLIDDQQARQLARFLDADAYSVGTLTRDGAALAARIRVLDIGGSGFAFAFMARDTDAVATGGNGGSAGRGADALGEAIAQRLATVIRAGERARECDQLRQRGDWSRALEAARKALEIEPALPAAHLCTATVYEAQRLPPDSIIAASRRALTGDSLSTRALETIARQYQIKGDTAAAFHAFEHLVEIDPGNKAIALGLAAQYQLRRDYERAERVLRALRERLPGDAQVSERLYQLCLDGARWRCVLEFVAQRVERDTALLADTAMLKVAIGAAQQAPDTSALDRFTLAALRHYPADVAFLKARVAALEWTGRPDSAVAVIRRVLELQPGDVAAALSAAKVIVEHAAYDTVGARNDSLVLQQRRAEFADRIETARSFLAPAVGSPDTAVRLNAAVLMLTAGSRLAQAQAYDRAYPWLDSVLALTAPATPADTVGPRHQIRVNGSFWYAVASTVTLRSALQEVIDKKSCALAAQVARRMRITREAARVGRRVHEPTMRQMLGILDRYDTPMRQVKEAYKCTGF
jgi:tetratricopeptide (TPR) repeat protein